MKKRTITVFLLLLGLLPVVTTLHNSKRKKAREAYSDEHLFI